MDNCATDIFDNVCETAAVPAAVVVTTMMEVTTAVIVVDYAVAAVV